MRREDSWSRGGRCFSQPGSAAEALAITASAWQGWRRCSQSCESLHLRTCSSLSGDLNLKLGQKLMPILHQPCTCMRTWNESSDYAGVSAHTMLPMGSHTGLAIAPRAADDDEVAGVLRHSCLQLACVIWLRGMSVPSTLCTTSAATCMPAGLCWPMPGDDVAFICLS